VSPEAQPEDDTILAAVDALEVPAPAEPAGPASAVEETLGRLYVELLGLLAYQLPPLAPSPEVKQRLMAAVTGVDTQELPEEVLAEVRKETPAEGPPPPPAHASTGPRAARDAASPARDVVPPWPKVLQPTQPAEPAINMPWAAGAAGPAARRPAAGTRPAVTARTAKPPPQASPRRTVFGLGPQGLLAAAVVVLLAGANVFLLARVLEQRRTIAFLDQRLQVEGGLVLRRIATASSASRELEDLRRKLALVTSPDVVVAALEPAGTPPTQPAARGVVFVAVDHQHWYLSVAGLAPSPPGRSYQLWFLNDAGPQNAGVFRVAGERAVELASPQMPLGTREVKVTLEPESGSPRPSGPEILGSTQFRTL
jgi:hypothetical protein